MSEIFGFFWIRVLNSLNYPAEHPLQMNYDLEYIDDYFQKVLSEEQRNEFDSRCVSDEAFAKEVAIYVAMREALRQNFEEEKKKHWSKLVRGTGPGGEIKIPKETEPVQKSDLLWQRPLSETEPARDSTVRASASTRTIVPAKRIELKKWLSLAAAACVIALLLFYPRLTSNSARDLVHEYVQNELTISNTMDASRDSLQAGIVSYNNKNYEAAIKTFKSLYASKNNDEQILRYLGQAYLMDRDYENALKHFELLIKREELRSNPGEFLKAITLMERNAPGDEQQAKTLFQKVVSDKSEGETHARVWLEKMD
jgi:tetratricopeptide (TPR) repeat protein